MKFPIYVGAALAALTLSGTAAAEQYSAKLPSLSHTKVAAVSTTAKASIDDANKKASVASDSATKKKSAAVSKPKAKSVSTSLVASIDLSGQRMTIKEHGKVKYVWKISSGRAGYRTPTGTYRPKWMSRMHYSRKYNNAPMPHSVFFHGGYAIHATYATSRLGAPASHGCIRLAPSNARTFFKLVKKHKMAGTRVSLHGVARDTKRSYAKKKTRKKKYSAYKTTNSTWTMMPKKYSYSSSSYTWPGDRPRRAYRRGGRRYNRY